jgi:hypothetical protein
MEGGPMRGLGSRAAVVAVLAAAATVAGGVPAQAAQHSRAAATASAAARSPAVPAGRVVVTAPARPARLGSPAFVGGAFARQGANACSWTVGSPGIEKTFAFAAGSFTMSSFRNTLVRPAAEYVVAGSPSPGFSFGWDGAQLSGASGGWQCVSGATSRVLTGGAPVLELDVVLSRPGVRVAEHYLMYPDVAFISEWADYTGTDGQDHQITQASMLDQQVMGDRVADTDLVQAVGGQNFVIDTEPVGSAGYGSDTPWLALWDRVRQNGFYAGDVGSVGSPTDSNQGISAGEVPGGVSVLMVAPDQALAAGATLTTPKAFTGVYKGDLDDMTNRLLDWQYGYMWDYTRAPYFPGVRDEGNYQAGLGDGPGTIQKVFGLADHMRAMGVNVYARDYGWPVDGTPDGGIDWRLSGGYLAKSGMFNSIYLANDYVAWGPMEWRIDNTGLPTDNAVQQFLDACKQCGYNGVNDPGHFGFNLFRFADATTYTLGLDAQDGATQLFQADKLSQIPEFTQVTFLCDPAWANENLIQNPYLWGDTSTAAQLECVRKMDDMYHYLAAQGVAGRWSQQYHPHASDGLDSNWFERLSADGQRGVVFYKGGIACYFLGQLDSPCGTLPESASPVTVYPKGLNPGQVYDVRFEVRPGHMLRSGADLMANGVSFAPAADGERIYLGLPRHPGAGNDHTAPTPPSHVTATAGTEMGYPGAELNWAPGSDDTWVSRYQVLRDGKVAGTVSTGTYYFDHTPGSSTASYAVRTVDGDGNTSAAAAATTGLPAAAAADDGSPAVSYTGTWDHQAGLPDAYQGTQSVPTSASCATACQNFGAVQGTGGWSFQQGPWPAGVPCHSACLGFSTVQGTNGWSYQASTGGQWNDITNLDRNFGLFDCCSWYDLTSSDAGTDFTGLITARYMAAGSGHDVARAWTAPKDGVVDIQAQLAMFEPSGSVVATITKNGQPVWGPQTVTGDAPADTSATGVQVTAGDVIRFEFQGTPELNVFGTLAQWDPDVLYQGDPPPAPPSTWTDIANFDSADFSGDGPVRQDAGPAISAHLLKPTGVQAVARVWTAPRDGVVDISGVASGGPVSIVKNGQVIFGPQATADNQPYTGTDVRDLAVAAGDVIRFEAEAGGRQTRWDPNVAYQGDPASVPVTAASWTFTGSEVTWDARLGPDQGVAEVFIDGTKDATINLYAPDPGNWAIPVYTRTFPAAGPHTISVVPTGVGQGDSLAPVSVDGFRAVTGTPVVTEDDSPRLTYAGPGWQRQAGPAASGGHLMASSTAGDSVSFRFTGSAVTWAGRICPACGEADVYLDGTYVTRVDTFGYRGPQIWQAAMFQHSWTHPGNHTLTIVVTGTKNFNSTAAEIDIDNLRVVPAQGSP